MADVLILETESTPLNTELETLEPETATELQEPTHESTLNPSIAEPVSETAEPVETAAVGTDLDFAAAPAEEPVVIPAANAASASVETTPVASTPAAADHDHDFDMGDDFSAQLEAFERE